MAKQERSRCQCVYPSAHFAIKSEGSEVFTDILDSRQW